MSLYDDLGGAEAVSVALDRFYAKIPSDPIVAPYFEGVNMVRLKERASPFVVMALGGPNEYKGPGLRLVHRHLVSKGMNDEAFEAFVGLFVNVLNELSVPEDKVYQVMDLLESVRSEVMNR